MKRIIVLALACAVAPLAGAQLYKYVDKDGRTVYSDQPPPAGESKQLHVNTGTGTAGPSYVARDKALDKTRQAEKDKEKKKEIGEENAKLAQQRCAQATESYHTYQEGGRLFRTNEKGEREFLSDEEIEAARVKSKQEMDEACKSS
ncbi:MAG TPA: DUF4124 domain-containing protein [Usitatibacter sp.]|nr:DUF4124 domain-containing protein [Usitatibacter sp.]